MIGVDLVSTKRIESLVNKYGEIFLKKILNNEEIALVRNDNGFNINRIAGFFATKEALSKALGCGIGGDLRFHDITIFKDSKNAPKIKLDKNVIQYFNIKDIDVSISHDNGCAISFVFVKKNEDKRMENNNEYLFYLESKLSKEDLMIIKSKLDTLPKKRADEIVFLDLKSPILALVLSLCFGIFGVDRFYQGRIGLGVAKLLLSWALFPWIIIDWFLIMRSIKKDNMVKIMEFLE
ncbi:hypothetical protein CCY99_00745 [Helicobacter sp. 16-1353]|uniref:holo-ACP synthase n=1 Tax=Helicobacter sp. 16-1353 TaxID=2004996 RepID=UPI000DCCB00F|nr:holo-ACP synthase [Helicobacter sp. 16-1353]RAX55260.1 hypothetical protein CCY99_00745 [Helicobacter sp. 16-1353]